MKVILQRTLRLGRGETGMLTDTIPLHSSHRLGHENSNQGETNGIHWTMLTKLDDLDFADDLALLSHSHRQMQDKTTELTLISALSGWVENQQKENKDPKNKCYLRNTNHS